MSAPWRAVACGALGVLVVQQVWKWLRKPKAGLQQDRPLVAMGFPSLIGNTPMVRLESLSQATGCTILAKAEYLNPGGSSKDRVAKCMVEVAEASGQLGKGGTIVEGTSGSTGISLALMAQARGYGCVLVMPDDTSPDKVNLMKTLGAQVEVVKPCSIVNSEHCVNVARQRARELEGGFFTDQFENKSNFQAHYRGTGPEIWRQTSGTVDAFVMSAGTGGTIAGVSRFLKEHRPQVRVVLVDPPGSALYNRVKHGVLYTRQQAERLALRNRYDTVMEGIGLDRLTANFQEAVIDDALRVSDEDAIRMAHHLLKQEGLFVGASSAMNCVGAVRVAQQLGPGHTIVTVLCDAGHRYMSNFYKLPIPQ